MVSLYCNGGERIRRRRKHGRFQIPPEVGSIPTTSIEVYIATLQPIASLASKTFSTTIFTSSSSTNGDRINDFKATIGSP